MRRDLDEQSCDDQRGLAGGGCVFRGQAHSIQRSRVGGGFAAGGGHFAFHRGPDYGGVRQGGGGRLVGAPKKAGDGGKHPKNRRGILQNSNSGFVIEAAQPFHRAAASSRDGAGQGIDQSQSSGDRRRIRRSGPHDRAACVQASQGVAS